MTTGSPVSTRFMTFEKVLIIIRIVGIKKNIPKPSKSISDPKNVVANSRLCFCSQPVYNNPKTVGTKTENRLQFTSADCQRSRLIASNV